MAILRRPKVDLNAHAHTHAHTGRSNRTSTKNIYGPCLSIQGLSLSLVAFMLTYMVIDEEVGSVNVQIGPGICPMNKRMSWPIRHALGNLNYERHEAVYRSGCRGWIKTTHIHIR